MMPDWGMPRFQRPQNRVRDRSTKAPSVGKIVEMLRDSGEMPAKGDE